MDNRVTSRGDVFFDCIYFDKECDANTIPQKRKTLFKKQFKLRFPDGFMSIDGIEGALIQIVGKHLALDYFFWLEKFGFTGMSIVATNIREAMGFENNGEMPLFEFNEEMIEQYSQKFPINPVIENVESIRLAKVIQALMIVASETIESDLEKIKNKKHGG